jgi:hypothetical protein
MVDNHITHIKKVYTDNNLHLIGSFEDYLNSLDNNGEIAFHGTSSIFDTFDTNFLGSVTGCEVFQKDGFWFSNSYLEAKDYSFCEMEFDYNDYFSSIFSLNHIFIEMDYNI